MTDEPTLQEATERARGELKAEHDDQIRLRARQILNASQATARAREREEELARLRERERAEITQGAVRAQRKLYGREIARKLSGDARYWILRSEGRAWAFTRREAIMKAAMSLSRGGLSFAIDGQGPGLNRQRRLLDLDPGIEGVAITRHVATLDAVDPPLTEIEELASDLEQRRSDERRRRVVAATERRRMQREERLYGVAMDAAEE